MQTTIKELLLEKGIQVTMDEVNTLDHQWNAIQQLKNNFETAKLDEYDIAVTHDLGGVYHE